MTRDDAIKIFNTVLCLGKCDCSKDEIEECLKMAIEALEPQPSKRTEERTETHECDCISREEALETIEKYADEYEHRANRIDTANPEYPAYHAKKRWNGIALGLDKAKELLTDLPSATPQPKTGHWIGHKHGGIEHIECSKCRCWFLRKDLIRNSYCPNCGSRNHWEWELKMQEVKK